MSQLRITLNVEKRRLELAEPFTIATKRYDSAVCLLVRVHQGEVFGIGEVSPESRWNETPEGSLEQVSNADLGALGGPFDLVFCGSVLIHLRDPMLALERMAGLCCGRLVLAELLDVAVVEDRVGVDPGGAVAGGVLLLGAGDRGRSNVPSSA